MSPSTLVFNRENWNTDQNVTVTVAQDSDTANGSREITHIMSGGGHNHRGYVFLVTALDDDVGFSFHETEDGPAVSVLSVAEGTSKTYWVGIVGTYDIASGLGAQVRVSSGDSDISVSPSYIEWVRCTDATPGCVGDYSKKQVTLAAAQDGDSVNGEAVVSHFSTDGGIGSPWLTLPAVDLTVREIDDDASGGSGGQGAGGQVGGQGGGGEGDGQGGGQGGSGQGSGGQGGGQSDPVQPPGSIGSVNATRVNDVIAVEWSAAQHATGYHVVYSTDGGSSWTRVSTNQSGLGYTLGKADAKLSYIVGVQAVNSAGVSAWVNSGTVPPAPVVLGSPSLSVTGVGSASWSYSVPDGADFVYYEIRWRATAGQSGPNDWSGKSNLVFYNRDKLSHTIDGLDSGTEYKAKVFVGLKVDGKWRYAKSNTVVFTAE